MSGQWESKPMLACSIEKVAAHDTRLIENLQCVIVRKQTIWILGAFPVGVTIVARDTLGKTDPGRSVRGLYISCPADGRRKTVCARNCGLP